MNLAQHLIYYVLHQIKGRKAANLRLPLPPSIFNKEPIAHTADASIYRRWDQLRSSMLHDRSTIKVTDYGAGERENSYRTIASIARKSSQKSRFNTLQYHLIKHTAPTTLLEMGTSFGLTTALFAMAAPEARIITMEGCPNTASKARETFRHLGLNNIELVVGPFDTHLDEVLKTLEKLDYVYFDGNHRMAPTLNYFLRACSSAHAESVFVLDDIRWSKQMYEAWLEINKHPAIRLSLDLYAIGVLTFNPEHPVHRKVIRY